MPEQLIQRPRFFPIAGPEGSTDQKTNLNLASDDGKWIPLLHCPANFPSELFEVAISQLVHHPEYNSTLILRSETVSETTSQFPDKLPILPGLRPVQNVHRKLLPRRPGRDAGLEQHCTLYSQGGTPLSKGSSSSPPSVLVLSPILEPGSILPYYHPTVYNLAFRYLSNTASDTPSPQHGTLQVEVIPLPGTRTDVDSRLYRTCLALLETLHRYGWGAMTNYKKRVNHDCIVPREEYQDLYLVMRERHRYLMDDWKESTDPLKHVFEDIGIATFLMLLWKQMYADPTSSASNPTPLERQPWPRPPGGFLDLGCGNGLLTHILISEGYSGQGVDLRKRMSWDHYPEMTQKNLYVEALDPTSLSSPSDPDSRLRPGVFIIGNHADELTPWVPVLSTLCDASGYLSIPCCPWTFDTKYERSKHPPYPVSSPLQKFIESLRLGGDGSNASAYSKYRIWLSTLHAHCGWTVESESLRIPSTRNWALVGRRRAAIDNTNDEGKRHAEQIVENVRIRGVFKPRRPEGKAGEH